MIKIEKINSVPDPFVDYLNRIYMNCKQLMSSQIIYVCTQVHVIFKKKHFLCSVTHRQPTLVYSMINLISERMNQKRTREIVSITNKLLYSVITRIRYIQIQLIIKFH